MPQPKVEKQPIYVLPEVSIGIKMPKKTETPAKEIKIPFLAEGQEPYKSPYANFYGVNVDKSLVEKVRLSKRYTLESVDIDLKDGTNISFYPNENIGYANGTSPKIYKDKDGVTVFSNMSGQTILKSSESNNKSRILDSKIVLFKSYAKNDTLQIQNCTKMNINSFDKNLVVVDTAADPTKKPSLTNSNLGKVQNKLFWTENVKEKNN